MLLDRILAELSPGTKIPKPTATGTFKIKGEGMARGERAIVYTIPNRKNPDKPSQKGITATQLEKAYGQLVRSGHLTREWWNDHARFSRDEGGCNFTTVGGLLELLGEAEYARRGVYLRRSGGRGV